MSHKGLNTKDVIARNAIVAFAVRVITTFFRLFLPPIILKSVSLEEYGIWASCFILINYIGMGAFGISNVYVRHAALYAAQGKENWISRLVSTGMISVGLFSVVVLAALYLSLPLVLSLFHISESLHTVAAALFFWTMAMFLFDLTMSAFGSLLQSLQKIVYEQTIVMVASLVEMALIIVFLLNGFGIYSLLYAFVFRYVVSIPLQIFYCYRFIPALSIRFRNFDKSMLLFFFKYGGIVQLSAMLSVVTGSVHKIIAGSALGVRAVGLIDLGEKIPYTIQAQTSALNMVFLPAAAHMHAQGEHSKIKQLHIRGSRYVNILTGFMMGFLLPFAYPLIVCWLGPKEQFVIIGTILALFTIPYQLNVMTGPSSAIFRSTDHPQRELWNSVPRLLLTLAVCVPGPLFFGMGLTYLVAATAGVMAVTSLFYFAYSNYQLGVNHWQFTKEALLPGLVPYIVGYAIYGAAYPWLSETITSRWDTLPIVLLALAAYVVVAGVIIYKVVFPLWERQFFLDQLFRKWRRKEDQAVASAATVQTIHEDEINPHP